MAVPIPSPPITWLKVVGIAGESRNRVPLSCSPVKAIAGLPFAGSPVAMEYERWVTMPRFWNAQLTFGGVTAPLNRLSA